MRLYHDCFSVRMARPHMGERCTSEGKFEFKQCTFCGVLFLWRATILFHGHKLAKMCAFPMKETRLPWLQHHPGVNISKYNITPSCQLPDGPFLMECEDQLSVVFTKIYNLSLSTFCIPSCMKPACHSSAKNRHAVVLYHTYALYGTPAALRKKGESFWGASTTPKKTQQLLIALPGRAVQRSMTRLSKQHIEKSNPPWTPSVSCSLLHICKQTHELNWILRN